MAKLPEPPPVAALRAIPPATRVLKKGTTLWRIYSSAGAHPVRWDEFRSFGPTTNRFDHHLSPPSAPARKILYSAADGLTCFAECFQAARTIELSHDRRKLVAFELARDVVVLDLTGTWPTRAGASMAISSGPRARARRWSIAIYDAYPRVEGLLYGSSMNANREAVALYERAEDAVRGRPALNRLLVDPSLRPRIGDAARKLGYGVAP